MAWYQTALISAFATLLAAIVAVAVAIIQIINLRRIARTRATLDFILKYESDALYLKAVEAFRAFNRGEFTAEQAISPPNDEIRQQAAHLSAFLNFQELIALGIRHGAFRRLVGVFLCQALGRCSPAHSPPAGDISAGADRVRGAGAVLCKRTRPGV